MKQRGGKRIGAGRKLTDGIRKLYKRSLPTYLMNNEHVQHNTTRAIIDGLKLFIAHKESLKQTPEKK